jgi:glycine/D-amino acid oxidase-like deaminating enzyme
VNAIATTEVPLPFPAPKGILFPNQAQFNALAYLQALASAIDGDGRYVFEQTRVLDTNGDPARVSTQHGTISAQAVVLATHTPIHDITRLQDIYLTATIKVIPYQSYSSSITLGKE